MTSETVAGDVTADTADGLCNLVWHLRWRNAWIILEKSEENEGYFQLKNEVLKHFINSRLPLASRLA